MAPLERAMRNLGLQMIGTPGEAVIFDGAYHECPDPVFPGDQVKILRPGWFLRDPSGELLLTKALVEPVASD
jgi:hypothetical protein